MKIPTLVSPQWLHDNLNDPQLGIIDNAWDQQLYTRGHIPGAIATPAHPHLKHFDAHGNKSPYLLIENEFADLCHRLGIRSDRHYVIYDDWHGLFAARFWWLCRHYGFEGISVLDGGLQGWCAVGYPVTKEVPQLVADSDILPQPRNDDLITLTELLEHYHDDEIQLWDTRRPAEYCGRETSDNQRQGHLPGALNLDWTEFLRPAARTDAARFLLPPVQRLGLATAAGLKREKTIIPYCQSGVRAAFGLLVLHLLGFPRLRLYDSSLFEWANTSSTPLVRPEETDG